MKPRFLTRIVLFVLTNLAILIVLGIALRLLGVDRMLDAQGVGLDYRSLLVMSAVIGFGGSLISLAISKWIAKRSMGVEVITQPRSEAEIWYVGTVKRLAEQAGIGMPEVGVWESDDMNAFATGARRNNALVAVSTGLFRGMNRDEVEAVLAHEIAHVANGDMVTLALLQGVVNTFVIFLARVIGYVVDRTVFRTERGHGPGFWITAIVAEITLGILATMIVLWYSRRREFRADRGAAQLKGPRPMIAALQRLASVHGAPAMPDSLKAFAIRGPYRGGLARLFSSHPPIEERIAALQQGGGAR